MNKAMRAIITLGALVLLLSPLGIIDNVITILDLPNQH